MLHRRIGYAGLLAAAVLFQIVFVGWLSTFLLALAFLFPLLSLALSLPGMRLCRLSLGPRASRVVRGAEGAFVLSLSNPTHLPMSRVRVWYDYTNQLTGTRRSFRRDFCGAGGGAAMEISFAAPHCGQVVCRISRARVCDLLGLFSLPVRHGGSAALLITPEPLELPLPPELTGSGQQGVRLRPRPGGGPGEDYDLRDYRAGDPLRAIHWKLSSKRDELVVRETLEPHRAPLALTYDHFGAPEELDRVFACLCALSRGLLEQARPHAIVWADPRSGAVHCSVVTCPRELAGFLEEAFSLSAPAAGRSVLDGPISIPGEPGVVRRLHITPQWEGGSL